MQTFEGKTALITGGSSGIGLALARQLAGLGMHMILLARDAQKLDAACQEVTAARRSPTQRISTITADVSNEAEVTQRLQSMIDAGSPPDLLINSAGITHPGLFEQMDLHIHRSNMEINYFGTLYTIRGVLPAMIRRGSGHIVNISSLVGVHGLYGYSAYSPSKFALVGLSDCLRYELRSHGIQVSIAFPSDTQTPQLDYENRYKPPLLKALVEGNSKPVSADSVAQKIIRGIMRNKYIILPTVDSQLWFAVHALFPGNSIYWLVDRLMDQARRKVTKDKAGE